MNAKDSRSHRLGGDHWPDRLRSIVLGELTAKRLALQRAESCALTLAPLVDLTASWRGPSYGCSVY